MTENDIRSEWERHAGDILPEEEMDKAFSKVMQSADKSEEHYSKSGRTLFLHRLHTISVAAAAIAAIAFIPWITLKVAEQSDNSRQYEAVSYNEVSTLDGETKDITLPDGSTVKLNAGSVIFYPEHFSSAERSVYISGEAVFRVVHNPQVPFVVGTSDMDITVHGTTFNVKSYPEDRNTSASLCEGSISAYIKNEGKTLLMTPDQKISYDRISGCSTLTKVNSKEETAWESGDLCFRSESIHDILKTIERMYGINAYVTSGKYDGVILTAKFIHGESLQQMLTAICRIVPGMSYEIENNNVYIR